MSKKVLIVDDEPNIVISLEFLVKKEGFTVAVAADGEEALAKVAEFSPDLILLDAVELNLALSWNFARNRL